MPGLGELTKLALPSYQQAKVLTRTPQPGSYVWHRRARLVIAHPYGCLYVL